MDLNEKNETIDTIINDSRLYDRFSKFITSPETVAFAEGTGRAFVRVIYPLFRLFSKDPEDLKQRIKEWDAKYEVDNAPYAAYITGQAAVYLSIINCMLK